MHQKFGVSQADFDAMVENQEYTVLAEKLKANLDSKKIREGDYEASLKWLKETAKMNGKSL